jgi:SAM-dependent methyltransferase
MSRCPDDVVRRDYAGPVPSDARTDERAALRNADAKTLPSGQAGAGGVGSGVSGSDRPVRARQVDELLIEALGPRIGSATVLDCGGGSGRFAVPLAVAGATVTVVDISVDALATLLRRAIESVVSDRVIPVQGDVEHLADSIGEADFDLVLAHGVLDVIDPLPTSFAGIVAAVRPGGLLSVLIANPVAGVLARALAGDLSGAERELAALAEAPDRPGPDTVRRLCAEHGLVIEQQRGVGVFRDLVPGQALDAPGARESLARLEARAAQRSPFAEIAGRVHILARRRDQG